MSYYFLHQPKKIPAILAYSIIGILIVVFAFFLRGGERQTTLTRATKATEPLELTASNITTTSTTISFKTSEPVKAYIKYADTGASIVKFDDRDTSITENSSRTLHYFSLQGLTSNTTYSFSLFIEGQEKTSQAYQFKTLPTTALTASNPPTFGKVLQENLQPSSQALITLVVESNGDKVVFTSLSKETGEWIITLPYVATPQGKNISLSAETVLQFTFTDGQSSSKVRAFYRNTNPLQSVVLGKDYDLTLPVSSTTPIVEQQQTQLKTLTILSPANNSVITGQHPVFRGLAQPNSIVEIAVSPQGEGVAILADKLGEWKYETKISLLPGKYLFIARSKTENRLETITFYIAKSGEAVLGDATASATMTPAPAPTATTLPTAIPTSPDGTTPAPTPTTTTTITAAPTTTIISTPTPAVLIVQPTTTSIPVAGFSPTLLTVAASTISLIGLFLIMY